jgi:hypothetical protein
VQIIPTTEHWKCRYCLTKPLSKWDTITITYQFQLAQSMQSKIMKIARIVKGAMLLIGHSKNES